MKSAKRLNFFKLLLAIYFLVSATPVWAAPMPAVIRACSLAFRGEVQPTAAEEFFNTVTAAWKANNEGQTHLTAVVRAAIKETSRRSDWDQQAKVNFWRAMVGLIRRGPGKGFICDEHPGLDGSVVFQGGQPGSSLIFAPNGDVYRGEAEGFMLQKAKLIWKGDYSGLTLLNPPAIPSLQN